MTTAVLKQRKFDLRMHEGWSAFVFLSLALIMVTWSISEAGYDEGLKSLVFITAGAIVASLFLAKSHLPWFLSHLFSLVYGVAWNAFVISYQLPQTFTPRDRLLEIGYRLGHWFQQTVIGGELGTDPLMFTVVMSILFWLMTYIAMWFSFRAHVIWAALLPSGVTLLLNLYYGPDRIGFTLVPYLLFIMLFTVRFNLYAQEQGWKQHTVRYDTDIVFTFLRYGAMLSLIAIVFAWVVPSAASSEKAEVFFSRFTEPWDRVKEEWIRLFSTLQSERTQPSYASFGGTLELGGPVNLGNATLMDVQASAGRYWRANVYDRYTGEGWISGDTETVFLESGQLAGEMVPYEARRVITQTFTLYMPDTTQLYALGQPELFSMPVRANILTDGSVDGPAKVETIAMVNSRYKLKGGDSYMVISTIPSVDEAAMRQAGNELPAWTERYLQLPDDLPQRVRDLAQEVTAGYDNMYDKATAIQDYLRQYTYNEQIPRPPLGVDRVDYFLFESKEGYCNYYASAMAVMARAVGIPARVAAGYARGDWEQDAGVYRVRQYHSHAWVEVYLPRFGWIEFEPTANQSVIVRPRSPGDETPANAGAGGTGDYPGYDPYEDPLGAFGLGQFDQAEFERLMAEQRRQAAIRTWTRVGGVLAVSLVIILGAWWLGRRQMDELKPAGVYYDHMVRQADWWGCKILPSYTPNEYATKLSTSIDDSDADKLIHRITLAFVGEQFGKKNPGRYQPNFAWRDLRPVLTRWGIRNTWRRLFSARRERGIAP
jgi:transglutaminase-like putative cysteine protease